MTGRPHAPTRTPPPTYLDANRVWVDSWLRYQVGLHLEGRALARLLARTGAGAGGGRCVEIGTGRRGLGARWALTRAGAGEVLALDVHPASVARARRRTADLAGRVRVEVADATALPMQDAGADLVVSFHALHHVGDWRAAVRECARALRPGGHLVLTEMTSRVVDSRWLRALSRHPGDRFDAGQLLAELAAHGLDASDAGVSRTWFGARLVQAVARRR